MRPITLQYKEGTPHFTLYFDKHPHERTRDVLHRIIRLCFEKEYFRFILAQNLSSNRILQMKQTLGKIV